MSAVAAGRAFRPAPAIAASAACHVAGAAALAIAPASWPWVLGVLGAQHAAFFAASFMPRSRLIGANLSRLPAAARARGEIALTFDDGPDPERTPAALDALDRAGARATFFCVGRHVARHPDLAREIVRRGHAVENHTERHPETFGFFGLRGYAAELGAAQATISATIGHAPRFFRAPFGIRNPLLDPAAQRLGLTYVSWTRRGLDTIDGDPASVSRRVLDGLAPGDILTLHDGLATSRGRIRRAPIDEVLERVLAGVQAAGLRAVTLGAALELPTTVPDHAHPAPRATPRGAPAPHSVR